MSDICIIKILDEVNAVVIGLRKKEYDQLYERYAIHAKNYFFNPKYKLGRWDGKIGFFTKSTGKTYVNLLPDIIPIVKSWGYKFQLKDNRSPVTIDIPEVDANYFADKGIVLADHQINAINAATQNTYGCVEAGTGAGKTFVNGAIVDLYAKHCRFKTITIVPTVDLVSQTRTEFIEKLGLDTGEFSGTVKDLNHQHVISTWQTIQNDPTVMGHFQMVVCDEAHLATGPTLQAILNEHGSHIIARVGLTGTIPKDKCDAQTVFVTLGPVRFIIKASELMELGWLSQLSIKMIILEEPLHEEWEIYKEKNPIEAATTTYKEWKRNAFPDYAAERYYIENKKLRNEIIAGVIESRRDRDRGNCLILVNGLKQGQKLAELIPGSILLSGNDSKKIRKEVYKEFDTKNDMVVIATYKLASTGLNIPRIFYLFLIDGGKGFTKLIQSIGRGLRKAEDKDQIETIDIGSDLKYSRKHFKERMNLYTEAAYNFTKKMVEYC